MTLGKFEHSEAQAQGGQNSDHTDNLYNHVNQLRTACHHSAQSDGAQAQAGAHLPHFQIVDEGLKAAGNAITGGTKAAQHNWEAGTKQAQQAVHWFKHDLCEDNPVAMATVGVAAVGTAVLAAPVVTGAAVVEGAAAVAVGAVTLVADMGAVGLYLHKTLDKGQ